MSLFDIIVLGEDMLVKLFDEEDELDLEEDINNFISDNDVEVIDIKYQVSTCMFGEEQIYCFSSMIIYKS